MIQVLPPKKKKKKIVIPKRMNITQLDQTFKSVDACGFNDEQDLAQ